MNGKSDSNLSFFLGLKHVMKKFGSQRIQDQSENWAQVFLPCEQLVSPLRQTKEKPLQATVCFSIEHAQVRHAPRNTFDANY